eukprot:scaffold236_cov419-Prasinococcus_capsulatus_cf.AAC.7
MSLRWRSMGHTREHVPEGLTSTALAVTLCTRRCLCNESSLLSTGGGGGGGQGLPRILPEDAS